MIETRGLEHSYDDEPVLDGVDLTVADGEFLLLVGPNGAGKTTLVRHFNGLLEPDVGVVLSTASRSPRTSWPLARP